MGIATPLISFPSCQDNSCQRCHCRVSVMLTAYCPHFGPLASKLRPVISGWDGGSWSKEHRRMLRVHVYPCAAGLTSREPAPRYPEDCAHAFLGLQGRPSCLSATVFTAFFKTLSKDFLNKTLPSIMTTKPGASECSSDSCHCRVTAHAPGRHLLNGRLSTVYTVSSDKTQSPSEMNCFPSTERRNQ